MTTLTQEEATQFYDIFHKILVYTNDKYNVLKKKITIKDLEDQIVDLNDNYTIQEKIFSNTSILEDFIKENPYVMNQKELAIVKGFTAFVKNDFVVYKHEKDYSIFIDETNKCLFGVKGLHNKIEDVAPSFALPFFCSTILVPFNDKIIYSGLFQTYNISFGSGIKHSITDKYKQFKSEKGIIDSYKGGKTIADIPETDNDTEIIKYNLEMWFKNDHTFKEKYERAWNLAIKNRKNRIVFELEYAKLCSKVLKKRIKNSDGLDIMYYAVYRQTIVGVAKSKKRLIEICEENVSELIDFLYIFSV